MRVFSLLFLLIILIAVAAFALQNNESIGVQFFNWGTTASFAAVVGIAYLLGMLSGWSFLGAIRRSVSRVAEYRR